MGNLGWNLYNSLNNNGRNRLGSEPWRMESSLGQMFYGFGLKGFHTGLSGRQPPKKNKPKQKGQAPTGGMEKRLKDWADAQNGGAPSTQEENGGKQPAWPKDGAPQESGRGQIESSVSGRGQIESSVSGRGQMESGVSGRGIRAEGSWSGLAGVQLTRSSSAASLQQAVIWSEILGEPVSRKRRKKRMSR